MSKALRCDRCLKCFIPEESEGTMVKFRNPIRYTADDLRPKTITESFTSAVSSLKSGGTTCGYVSSIPPDEMVDLCPACSLAFLRFMRKDSQK